MSQSHAENSALCQAMTALHQLMSRLRAPDGCAWDRAQTFPSLTPYTIEEVYEVVDAVESKDMAGLREELGDLLFHVVFYCQIAAEEGHFTLAEVVEAVEAKMRARHPHVFGDMKAETPQAVIQQWEKIKQREKQESGEDSTQKSVFHGVSSHLPALLWALKIQQKMAKVGFDWPDIQGVIQQVHLEQEEFLQACQTMEQDALEAEMGDVLFSIANLARRFHINPEAALRRATLKCRNRFQNMEERLWHQGKEAATSSLDELEQLWQESKKLYP
ncbi:MAG: nucleoside triphosphate pyrophosphohydrolase [Magnetococcales bacterium]|nr:nucleoside triphosphate pyrophosphohydrolase [Magnetococcales bacterium]NGZ25279.1 nucleoside triphosphate pyrophosphohydrolase [Magnetococcales bacterium]